MQDLSGFLKLGHDLELKQPWVVESFWLWYLAIPMSFSSIPADIQCYISGVQQRDETFI